MFSTLKDSETHSVSEITAYCSSVLSIHNLHNTFDLDSNLLWTTQDLKLPLQNERRGRRKTIAAIYNVVTLIQKHNVRSPSSFIVAKDITWSSPEGFRCTTLQGLIIDQEDICFNEQLEAIILQNISPAEIYPVDKKIEGEATTLFNLLKQATKSPVYVKREGDIYTFFIKKVEVYKSRTIELRGEEVTVRSGTKEVFKGSLQTLVTFFNRF